MNGKKRRIYISALLSAAIVAGMAAGVMNGQGAYAADPYAEMTDEHSGTRSPRPTNGFLGERTTPEAQRDAGFALPEGSAEAGCTVKPR